MQAIHNPSTSDDVNLMLFQRAKIQVKCKQFTTFKEHGTVLGCCFKEQRYKLNASNSQPQRGEAVQLLGCFKEQRYKLNASNSQRYDGQE